jgi:hypothetical protein
MEGGKHMEFGLQFTEIFVDGKLQGIAFVDYGTDYIRYQIAAPTKRRNLWHIISVCRGGGDPFEFVSLGHEHTREKAFELVQREWIWSVLRETEAGLRNGDSND